MVKVLIIDDNPIFLETLTSVLKNFPNVAVVGACRSGVDGLRVARETRPQLALVDLHMPAPNGIDTAALLHAAQPDLRLVMISMSRPGSVSEVANLPGIDDFLWKPDLFAGLPALIEQAEHGMRGVQ